MKCALPLRSLLLLVGLFGMADAVVAQSVPIDLGTVGGTFSTPTGLNDSGQVVGGSWTTGNVTVRAFVWTATSGMVDLGTFCQPPDRPSCRSSFAFGVNNDGQVVGVSHSARGSAAFLWTAVGGMVDLGFSEARAVNDHGQVVGEGGPGAVLWTPTDGIVPLGTLGGLTQVNGLNNSGQVIGFSRISQFGPGHAFRWTATSGMVDLGTFGGTSSSATGINSSGHVVGAAFAPDELNHAFLWTPIDGMVDLGPGVAYGVNDHGQVVGVGPIGDAFHAVMWTPTDGMVDLGTLGGPSSFASDVNEHGQVVGLSLTLAEGATRGFSWTASDGMVELAPLPGYAASEAFLVNNRGDVVGISRNNPTDVHATMWRLPAPGDLTPPTLLLPETIVVDATGPAGATVTFVVSASDAVDPNPVVICSRLSGSVFPLLVTTVSCTATDAAGNSVRGMFNVVVKDAPQQLADTITLITGYNLLRLGTSLPDKLQIASDFAAAGQVSAACDTLAAFLNQVRAQTGKGLTVDQATELTTRAIRIQHVIGC